MRRVHVFAIALAVLLTCPILAQDDAVADSGLEEQVETELLLVEAVVYDGDGRTVAGLGKDDFQLALDGKIVEITSVDEGCPAGGLGDPADVAPDDRIRPADSPDWMRSVVVLFDYHHLSTRDRRWAIDATAEMIRRDKAANEEIMIAALAGRPRIEQRFTSDPDDLLASLDRMEYDRTLWNFDGTATTSRDWFEQLAIMMDVLAQYDGGKAVVLVSGLTSFPDTQEAALQDVAQRAAFARTSIYPGYAKWMAQTTPRYGQARMRGNAAGTRVLTWLAAATGGAEPPVTDDLSVSFVRAQRDLACHYAIGFELPADQAIEPSDVRVGVTRPELTLKYPRSIRSWTEQEQMRSRLRAAYADPEMFEHALVRGHVYPIRPDKKRWDTVTVLHLSANVETEDVELDLGATLRRAGSNKTEKFETSVSVPRSEDGSRTLRQVTVFGDSRLKPGEYDLTLVLSSSKKGIVVTSHVPFTVPAVFDGGVHARGPILARVVPDGVLIRADAEEVPDDTALDRVLGDDASFDPLMIHDIGAGEDLLAFWQVCYAGRDVPAGRPSVARQVLSEDGDVVLELDPVEIDLVGEGKVKCGGSPDRIAGGTLAPGEYRIEVTAVGAPEGQGRTETPLRVR